MRIIGHKAAKQIKSTFSCQKIKAIKIIYNRGQILFQERIIQLKAVNTKLLQSTELFGCLLIAILSLYLAEIAEPTFPLLLSYIFIEMRRNKFIYQDSISML